MFLDGLMIDIDIIHEILVFESISINTFARMNKVILVGDRSGEFVFFQASFHPIPTFKES